MICNSISRSIRLAERDRRALKLAISTNATGCGWLAGEALCSLASREMGYEIELLPWEMNDQGRIVALCGPWDSEKMLLLSKAGVEVSDDGRLSSLAGLPSVRRQQGFVAARLALGEYEKVVVAADTEVGLRNALLTLSDRLYLDAEGCLACDSFDGAHAPAFDSRHLKTDAMNCGPLRWVLDYWDPTTRSGVDEFARWLASFRISDYDLLAFIRGWGASYSSERFPALADPQHPNPKYEFYPHLIDRLHNWGIRVWASDVFLASGYTMEVSTNPAMLSPCKDASKIRPYRAGEGAFWEILGDPEAVACLSHPSAGAYYADVVDDILSHYPALDGLDFHIGHTFSDGMEKICRCEQCRDVRGNREGVYKCFAKIYEKAVSIKPEIRMKAAVKIFGDATRKIVERHEEFPNLEYFCWLRWIGNLRIEEGDGLATIGHEDGGGGLETCCHDPDKNISQARNYYRDYEPWIRIYTQVTRQAHLASISWEPLFHRELEQQYFTYSQLTWEPDLSWAELARRYVIRSQRREDDVLAEAYRLALEANAAVTSWGLSDHEAGVAQRVIQTQALACTPEVRERVAALGELLSAVDDRSIDHDLAHTKFNLHRSLAQTRQRLAANEVLETWH